MQKKKQALFLVRKLVAKYGIDSINTKHAEYITSQYNSAFNTNYTIEECINHALNYTKEEISALTEQPVIAQLKIIQQVSLAITNGLNLYNCWADIINIVHQKGNEGFEDFVELFKQNLVIEETLNNVAFTNTGKLVIPAVIAKTLDARQLFSAIFSILLNQDPIAVALNSTVQAMNIKEENFLDFNLSENLKLLFKVADFTKVPLDIILTNEFDYLAYLDYGLMVLPSKSDLDCLVASTTDSLVPAIKISKSTLVNLLNNDQLCNINVDFVEHRILLNSKPLEEYV